VTDNLARLPDGFIDTDTPEYNRQCLRLPPGRLVRRGHWIVKEGGMLHAYPDRCFKELYTIEEN